MSRKGQHKPHVSHERWLVSYADFITLLFAFFVVMYSSAQVDKRKVGQLALAIQVAFQKLGVFPASTTQIPIDVKEPMPFNTVQAIENAKRTAALGRVVPSPNGSLSGAEENGDLTALRKEMEHVLAPEISHGDIALRVVPDGLIISLREIGFFDSGSATIKAASQTAFERIVSLLAQREYRIRIEGHSDNVPIHTAQFPDNWALSTARSTGLVRLLIVKYHFAPERLSAAGYSEYYPVADNNTAEGRAQNRRVDLVILGKFAPQDQQTLAATPAEQASPAPNPNAR